MDFSRFYFLKDYNIFYSMIWELSLLYGDKWGIVNILISVLNFNND